MKNRLGKNVMSQVYQYPKKRGAGSREQGKKKPPSLVKAVKAVARRSDLDSAPRPKGAMERAYDRYEQASKPKPAGDAFASTFFADRNQSNDFAQTPLGKKLLTLRSLNALTHDELDQVREQNKTQSIRIGSGAIYLPGAIEAWTDERGSSPALLLGPLPARTPVWAPECLPAVPRRLRSESWIRRRMS